MKKILSLLCAAAMTASIFTGCNKDTSSSPDVQTDVQNEESTPEASVISFETHHPLSNPNADEVTQRVYDYICENFEEYILSCQQESTWMDSPDYEMNIIEEATGKLPAMRGLDYMNSDFKGVNQRAIEWWEKGGLVTICWHTGINGRGYNESKNDSPDFEKLFDESTTEHEKMMKNWTNAANALAELRDAGVPVLWRPFHEFDGRWFWWGKGGGENFIKLWQMMYDYFTNECGLTNLIWVLGYADNVSDGWYVGDDYCDIIGSDTYNKSNPTHVKAWDKLKKVTTAEKPIAFHECGDLPSVEDFENDGCIWSWFMVWHTEWIEANDKTNLSEVYNSDRVITLDELPAFK